METWKECAWAGCRKRFEPGRQANTRTTYCSPTCRKRAHRARHMIVTKGVAATSVQDDRDTASAPIPLPQGRAPFVLPKGYVLSDWTPWPPSRWRPIIDEPVKLSADDDLAFPIFSSANAEDFGGPNKIFGGAAGLITIIRISGC